MPATTCTDTTCAVGKRLVLLGNQGLASFSYSFRHKHTDRPLADLKQTVANILGLSQKVQIMNGWENFFASELGASATLTGLIFVGVSVNLKMITTRVTLTNRALEALIALIVILFISSLLLIPGQTFFTIGIEVLFIGLIAWIIVSFLHFSSLREMQKQYRSQFVPYLVLGQIAALFFVLAGVVLLIFGLYGLYWIVAATLLSFLAAFTDAWILLIEINR